MASFAYHLALSGAAAVGASSYASRVQQCSLEDSLCLGVLVLGSGFVCDMDSADSHHTHHALNIASAVAPALILSAAGVYLQSPTMTFLIASLSFWAIRIVLREVVRHTASHRGMFHSVPAAAVWFCMVFLAFRGIVPDQRLLFAAGACGGYLIHLILDAAVAHQSMSGQSFSPSKNSGFALKLYSPSLFANFICYALLLSLGFLSLRDAGLVDF